LKKLFLLLLCIISLYADESSLKKVVYDVTTGEKKQFEKNVLKGIEFHKTYYENKFEELEVAVVIHGDAYKFFVKDLRKTAYAKEKEIPKKAYTEIHKRLKTLAEMYDVVFLICEVGMKKHHIMKENIVESVQVIATSTVGLIDKQNEGFAYLPVP